MQPQIRQFPFSFLQAKTDKGIFSIKSLNMYETSNKKKQKNGVIRT